MTASQTSPGLWDDWDVLTVRKPAQALGLAASVPNVTCAHDLESYRFSPFLSCLGHALTFSYCLARARDVWDAA